MAFRIGEYSGSLSTIGASGDTQITVTSSADFPGDGSPWNPGDTARVSIEHPQTHEIVRRLVTAVTGNVFTLDQALGANFPVGSLVELRNDPATLDEFVTERATQADPNDQATIQREVRAQVKPSAQVGGGRYPLSDVGGGDQLDSENHDSVDQGRSIPLIDGAGDVVERISIHETREFVKADIDERTIPEGGTTGQALKKRTGANYDVSWQDDAEGSGGTGVTEEQAADIESSKQFETALRRNVELAASQTIRQAASNAAERFTGGKALPSQQADDELLWTVGSDTNRIKAQALRDKALASNGAQLNDSNSISWQPQSGGSVYRLALESGGQLLFASGDVGDYTTSVVLNRIDVEPAARQSSNEAWTRAKLPSDLRELPAYPSQNPATQILYGDGTWKVAPTGGTGVSEARVQQLIDAEIPTARRVPATASADGDDGKVLKVNMTTPQWELQSGEDVSIATDTFGGNLDQGNQQAQGPHDNAQAVAQAFNDYTPPLEHLPANLQLLNRNVVTGGWRADSAIRVSRVKGVAFTLNDSRTETYTPLYPNDGSDLGPLQSNVFISVRVSKSLFDDIPTAAERARIRVRLDNSGIVAPLLSTATYLGEDVDGDYDYFSLPIPDLPADSIARPELDAPTELRNVDIPAGSIVGQLRGQTAGLRVLLDGNIPGLSVTSFNAAQDGSATALSPAFSVASDGDNANGILEFFVRLSVGTTSETLSFTANETNTTITASGFTTAADLRAAPVFVTGGVIEGVRMVRVPLYAVSGAVYTEIGEHLFYAVRNASNEVSHFWVYRPNGVHSETGNGAFGAHMIAAFQRTDGGSSGGGGGTVSVTSTLPDLIPFDVAATTKSIPGANVDNVVLSDWSKVNLVTQPTAKEGITVNAQSEIVFSTAKKVNFHGQFDYTGDGSGGGSRIYTRFRVSKVGSPNTVVRQSKSAAYEKSTNADTVAQTTLSQGPRDHTATMHFPLDAAAGDRYIIEWQVWSQRNPNVTIVHADSEIDIAVREPTITVTQ